MSFARLIAILLLSATLASAAAYYIDYGAANDSANGTSTSTPWKRCPGMTGFAGSYSHAAGDRFIFKGGVTWAVAAFPFTIANSGTSGSRDYYGVDQAYYSGGSWTRPVWDMNYTGVSGNVPVVVTGSYLTLENIEIKRCRVPNSGAYPAFGVGSIQTSAGSTYVFILGCHIHNWRASTAVDDIEFTDSAFGGIFLGGGAGHEVHQCTVGPGLPPVGLTGNSGTAIAGYAWRIRSNDLFGVSEMLNTASQNIDYNTFRNGTNSYDPEWHANAIYHVQGTGGRVHINNNVFHDLGSTFQTMLLHGGYLGATNTIYYIYNNLIWNVTTGINIDESGIVVANSATRNYVWNNTVEYIQTVGAVNRSQTYHLTQIDARNNHWIANNINGNPIATAATTAAFAPVGSLVDLNNLWHTTAQAASAGYNIGNLWAPQSAAFATVDYGANLTASNRYVIDINGTARPAAGAWDAGAYEFPNTTAPVVNVVRRTFPFSFP